MSTSFSVIFLDHILDKKASRPKPHTVKLVESLMIGYDCSKKIERLFWYLIEYD